jgi:cytochrome c oxidase subunit 3
MNDSTRYYLPPPSLWPIWGSAALLGVATGFILLLAGEGSGKYVIACGALVLGWMLFGWFRDVIRESLAGKLNDSVDRSFRWGMVWFIFSEVMFFAALFGALFYVRGIGLPDLAQTSLLWPGYRGEWPTAGPGLDQAFTPMAAWGIPALNTLILLSSGVTVTWAHWGLKLGRRRQTMAGLALTAGLGMLFLALQAHEYMGATFGLGSGIYGAMFYVLTGFHGAHVTLGTLMLVVVLLRVAAGHFTPTRHFAFEAVSWYWHFVDVVWLLLFVFVYWL